jgi:DNA (cytosine-5)-methyltransferase 1
MAQVQGIVMTTFASIFSGGEGAGVGARSAGLEHIWGIEIDPQIASIARANRFNVYINDVRLGPDGIDEIPDVLHASPPCPNFSSAKHGGGETREDIELAQATAWFIRALRPPVFTLENVWLYRKSQSWRIIAQALSECGYWFDVAHINAADFGVPQTRKRMWVRALRGQMVPHLLPPEPWVGWYAAIEDLIPGLPETEFAPWQLKRMPDELRETVLMSQGISRDHKGGEYPMGTRCAEEPAYTVTANSNMNGVRAFLVTNSSQGGQEPVMRKDDEPATTVTQGSGGRCRAFLVTGQYNKPAGEADRGPQVRSDDVPANTITASNKGDWRAAVHGRVVIVDKRCLARFQSFPDDYWLPDAKGLASRVVGNAVPPLQYQKIIQELIRR